jgi:hypothetical protein
MLTRLEYVLLRDSGAAHATGGVNFHLCHDDISPAAGAIIQARFARSSELSSSEPSSELSSSEPSSELPLCEACSAHECSACQTRSKRPATPIGNT